MKLYGFQLDALDKVKGYDRVAFYLDMGLGKTFVGSEKLMEFGNPHAVVVCQKSKIKDWVEHFKTQYPILNGEVYFGKVGFDQTFRPALAPMRIWVINYDMLIREERFQKITSPYTLLLDESSLIQNHTTKRWKYIKKLHFENLILLSGTPISGKYEKLYTQAQLLNEDFDMSLGEWWERYVIYKTLNVGYPVKVAIDYKNSWELKRRWFSKNVVWLKTEEVLELPSKRFIDIEIPITSEYKKFVKDRVISIEGETIVADNPLVLMTHCRKLCAQYDSGKLEKFSELLDSTESRLIVFYNFTEELNRMMKVAKSHDRPISIVNGKEKYLDAYEREENSVTFVQYQAGAMGLNLQKANKIIFASPTLSCDLYMQAQKRIHRIGQPNRCTYYRLYVKGSVEEKIYAALERGEDYTQRLFEKEIEYGT